MEKKAGLQKFPVAFRTQRTVKQMEREDLVTEVQFRERERKKKIFGSYLLAQVSNARKHLSNRNLLKILIWFYSKSPSISHLASHFKMALSFYLKEFFELK